MKRRISEATSSGSSNFSTAAAGKLSQLRVRQLGEESLGMFARKNPIAGRMEDEYGTAHPLQAIDPTIVPSERVFAPRYPATSQWANSTTRRSASTGGIRVGSTQLSATAPSSPTDANQPTRERL